MDIASLSKTESGGVIVQVIEQVGSENVVLGSMAINSLGTPRINFTPTGSAVQLWILGAYDMQLKPTCYTYPVTTQETYLVDICDENKDRYRFGFNGQEKVNELKGIGNSLDFKFRAYDSRTARFYSVDPLTQDYPWYTPYQFAGNTPIQAIDFEGLEPISSGKAKQVYVTNKGSEVKVVSEVTIRVQVLNLSSTPNDKLNLSMVKGYINQFGNEVGGSHTENITAAFSLENDGKTLKPNSNPNTIIKATYDTKINMKTEIITSISQIADDAIVLGIVDEVRGGESALAVGSAEWASGLIPASSLANDVVNKVGYKLISHELGHIFGLGHSNRGSMQTQDASWSIGFSEKEKVEMNRNLIGNWYDIRRSIKKNKSQPSQLRTTIPMKSNFEQIYNQHGR